MSSMLFANAGLPLFVVMVPWAILGFVPIMLIEAAWYRWFLGVPWDKACPASMVANSRSTLGGWLLDWGIMAVISFAGMLLFNLVGSVCQLWFAPQQEASHAFLSWLTEPSAYPLWFLIFVCGSAFLVFPGMIGGPSVVMLGAVLVMLLPCYLVSYRMEAKHLQREWPELDPARVYRAVWHAHLVTYGLMYAVTVWLYLRAVEPNGFRWH